MNDAREVNAYAISRLLYDLRRPENREVCRTDPPGFYARYAVGERGMRLLVERDWQGLVDAGVSIYLLTKLGATLGVSLVEVGAAMRGMNQAEFERFLAEQSRRNRALAILPEGS
ncbi:MAG TPA: hypothetical protein VFB33_15090 [Candidatus Binataceae bacterium]|jgi:protocatechuate 4,5-dioxygenase alpha subunit|nr:hypothetical protein [Candidatus Binataceae bacterium]